MQYFTSHVTVVTEHVLLCAVVSHIQTLKGATKYAAATGHPFPKVDFTELDSNQPRSYYVFEEKGKPTVIHIPLFNMDNCKSEWLSVCFTE